MPLNASSGNTETEYVIIYINWPDCYITFYMAIWPIYVNYKIFCNGWLDGFK